MKPHFYHCLKNKNAYGITKVDTKATFKSLKVTSRKRHKC